jgi:radical SAM superfamily enzyme YgiQ (UPF0313 family)
MSSRRIVLINPKTKSFTTTPMYFNRALYSPLAGLVAVAALIPRDQYEVVLIDENIEPIDFDLEAELVGISAMTAYVNRGYEIADAFRQRGVPVVMGGVHPSFMPDEAMQHADAVVIGEAELVMPRVLDDLKRGCLGGIYRGDQLHPMAGLPQPRYDLVKRERYVTSTFIQTSRGCHFACKFCAEHLMNGLRFRYRPVDDVMREIDDCGNRVIALNDADFFGTPRRAAEVMRALKGRGVRWQAGVNSSGANNDELLELAADSGCYMLSIGFESISLQTLRNAHKHQNRPENFKALVEKIQSYGILVFGLFMFGFDEDDPSVFDETVKFNIDANYDVCAYSILTPYPGTITWYEMEREQRIVSYDWDKYDQGSIVYSPRNLAPQQLRDGHMRAYERFYSVPSILRRFPIRASRSRGFWSVYNLFFRKGEVTGRNMQNAIGAPTAAPGTAPVPPIAPQKKGWRDLVASQTGTRPDASRGPSAGGRSGLSGVAAAAGSGPLHA